MISLSWTFHTIIRVTPIEFNNYLKSQDTGYKGTLVNIAFLLFIGVLLLVYILVKIYEGLKSPAIAWILIFPISLIAVSVYGIFKFKKDFIVFGLLLNEASLDPEKLIMDYLELNHCRQLRRENKVTTAYYGRSLVNEKIIQFHYCNSTLWANVRSTNDNMGYIDFGQTRRAQKKLRKYLTQFGFVEEVK